MIFCFYPFPSRIKGFPPFQVTCFSLPGYSLLELSLPEYPFNMVCEMIIPNLTQTHECALDIQ